MRLNITGKTVGQLLMVCSLLFFIPQLQAEPLVLNDVALGTIIAGNTEQAGGYGGVFIGYESDAVIYESGGVVVSGEAQAQATGMNLVNGTRSAIANGVNIWDGKGLEFSELNVAQLNHFEQAGKRPAGISSYVRSDTDNRLETTMVTNDIYRKELDAYSKVADIYVSNHISTNEAISNVDTSLNLSAGAPGSSLGIFDLEANLGQGLAISGQLDALYDGGSAEFELLAAGSVSAKPEIKVGDYFSAGAKLTAEASLRFFAEVDLPTFEIVVNGAGCGVILGSCYASGSLSDTTEELIDKSSLNTLVEQINWSNSSSETRVTRHRSPFSLSRAQAEYIIVDGSSLILDSEESLELSGSAQSNARGMNVVNAVGSAVANAVNISHCRQLNYQGELTLTQFNYVFHGR